MPSSGHAPHAPLKLATPQKLAGRVIDPPVWVPSAARHIPLATAAALPALEPAGGAIGIPGIARARRVLAGELRGLGLAENDRAEVAENLHDRGIAFRQVAGAQRGPRPRRQSGGVDDVLHPDRDTEQRQSARLLARQLCLPGHGTSRAVRVNLDPCSDLGLRRFNSLQAFLENLHRSEIAHAQGARRLDQARGFAGGHVLRFQSIHELDSITTVLHPEPPPTTCEPMLRHSDDDNHPESYPLRSGATAAMSERTASRAISRYGSGPG